MAVTNIHTIRTTLSKSIQYIIDGNKTRNGELVTCSGCSSDAQIAAGQFEQIRKCGTGRSTVLAQHIIQSFLPNEITPENAHIVGLELCEKLLGNDYQYILAIHCDHEHIHNHIIFNNVNMISGKTFETEHNQKKQAKQELMNISDEICREHNLFVIEDYSSTKGKSHYEWEMDKQNLSWKAKLKYAIDQTVKASEDFDDFLKKCSDFGIEVVYNPNNKIDLKFKLAGQQRFTRAKTLGWYYESAQISTRIKNYKYIMNYTPKTKIIRTTTERMGENDALRNWAEIQNIKEASKAINTLTKYTAADLDKAEHKLAGCFIHKGVLANQLDTASSEINDLSEKIKAVEKFQKLKPLHDKYKSLTGREKKRFEKENQYYLDRYDKAFREVKELFPDLRVPTVESMKIKKDALIKERKNYQSQYDEVKNQIREIETARKTIQDYLHNERAKTANRKRNKNQIE